MNIYPLLVLNRISYIDYVALAIVPSWALAILPSWCPFCYLASLAPSMRSAIEVQPESLFLGSGGDTCHYTQACMRKQVT